MAKEYTFEFPARRLQATAFCRISAPIADRSYLATFHFAGRENLSEGRSVPEGLTWSQGYKAYYAYLPSTDSNNTITALAQFTAPPDADSVTVRFESFPHGTSRPLDIFQDIVLETIVSGRKSIILAFSKGDK